MFAAIVFEETNFKKSASGDQAAARNSEARRHDRSRGISRCCPCGRACLQLMRRSSVPARHAPMIRSPTIICGGGQRRQGPADPGGGEGVGPDGFWPVDLWTVRGSGGRCALPNSGTPRKPAQLLRATSCDYTPRGRCFSWPSEFYAATEICLGRAIGRGVADAPPHAV